MQISKDYKDTNKALWNAKTPHHIASDFYDMKGFLAGNNSLNSIELDLLGNISAKKILHLQCHFGQDTLSMARMGARCTGVDLSDKSIEAARDINDKLALNARFICCDLFDLPLYFDEKFDIVFTSYGTIGWLPDLNKWAEIIQRYLKPAGRFVFADFHPFIWMHNDDMNEVVYRYFRSEAIVENTPGTYTDSEAPIQLQSISWNQGIGEVLTALMDHGLQINKFKEFDYSPYNCFNNLQEDAPRTFRFKKLGNKIPMVYALQAINTK